jgi:hypothetical protein
VASGEFRTHYANMNSFHIKIVCGFATNRLNEPRRNAPCRGPLSNSRLPTTHSHFLPALCLLLLLAGCGRDKLEWQYGQRQGLGASKSVNGTAVLGSMFQKEGHHVYSWDALSPQLSNKADCIVWFPDDFAPPSLEVRTWLEQWLDGRPDRTLIYVGRGYDAEIDYWQRMLLNAPAEQKPLIQDRLASAKSRFHAFRNLSFSPLVKTDPLIPQNNTRSKARPPVKKPRVVPSPFFTSINLSPDDWFVFTERKKPLQVRTLDDRYPWCRGIDASKLDIELTESMIVPRAKSVRPLLKSGVNTIVAREEIGQGQLLVVANGSFLLNMPLVNHEHRKLAAKLIDQIGPQGQTVVFLESDIGGPTIRNDDPKATESSGMAVFNMWPTNWILLQLAAIGVLYCFVRWPIFGLPKSDNPGHEADFARHIDALADLLEKSQDRAFAKKKIEAFKNEQTE